VQWAEVSWTSGGQTLSGIYVYPEAMRFPPTEPAPLVVWQQGGPGGQMTNDYGGSVESPYSLLANFGIPVLVANAAGRNVKSPQFYADMAEGRNFGQLDITQIKDGVDALVRQGIADAANVGITGCSYGGYFTLQSLRSFPGFYAAGNPQCTLADLTEEFTFGYTPFISYLMGRAPMADPAEYVKDSPMYGTKSITTPTLIFHGTKDFLPVPLINNIHDQIEANDVAVRFLRAAGYGHGLGTATDAQGNPIPGSNTSGQRYAFQLQLEFFRDYVGAAAPSPSNEVTAVFLPSIHNGAEAGGP
jgi:dipeptidyl aminopeptidase/acylaminoacyl peptidase